VSVAEGLTDALNDVCRLLSGEARAAAVARALGEVVEEQSNALRVRPHHEHFRGAYVVHDRDGDVEHVELELRRPLPLDVLGAAFGHYTEPPRIHWDSPRKFIFDAEHGACSVIARVEDVGGTADSVTIRRDA
jgi:hypothetical protein